ncbi:MAG: hypothetical protein LBQ55_09340, partial [Treponema sp.]|nr:hypothetical protein [Treponema sp.]
MEPEIVFIKTAFKHGVKDTDIRHAIKTYCYEEVLNGYEGKYLVLGYDTNGNPLEIVYKEFGENGMCVFHAMPCQE